MQMISRLAAVHSLPQFGLQEDVVFVGRITFGDEGEQEADVWLVPEEDSLRLQFHPHDHECGVFPIGIARLVAEQKPESQWGEAIRLLDEMRGISTRVAVDPYLGNVKISAHPGVHEDEDGEGGYGLIFVTHDGVPQDLLNEYVRERHPSTHCQHEYDCCGRAYADRANCIRYSDVMAIYQQSWHLNI